MVLIVLLITACRVVISSLDSWSSYREKKKGKMLSWNSKIWRRCSKWRLYLLLACMQIFCNYNKVGSGCRRREEERRGRKGVYENLEVWKETQAACNQLIESWYVDVMMDNAVHVIRAVVLEITVCSMIRIPVSR